MPACCRVASSIFSKLLSNIEWCLSRVLQLTTGSDRHYLVLPHPTLCKGWRRLWIVHARIVQQFRDILNEFYFNTAVLWKTSDKPFSYCWKSQITWVYFDSILRNLECVMTLWDVENVTSQALGTQEACFTWIVSDCKLRPKQMFDSVFSLHHSCACKVLKGDLFISQSNNKEKERKPAMHFIIIEKRNCKAGNILPSIT